MDSLADCPDLLTVNEVAEILRLKPNTVYSLKELRKTHIGNGRAMLRYRKIDLISYINAGVEEEVTLDDNQKTERYPKMGLRDLVPWKEIQEERMEHAG
ncbi:MAG: helix-turn-helix domain-containing protein [Syntrophales bacterium]|nr:helix-turn-helix domain-containing protein [Syntrophales bacterium]